MGLLTLLKRAEKAAPLTIAEHDANLTAIEVEVNGRLEATDGSVTNAREWIAETVDQAEAEAGTSTTRRAFTAQRVFQAIAAWWAASSAKTKLDGIAAGATANATDAQLRDRATHTGTQAISTVTGLQTALDGLMPVGTLIDVSAGVTLTPVMNGFRFDTATTSRAFTVPTSLGGAFVGVTVHGPCTWVASGTTVTDRRQTGQGYDLCQLMQVRVDQYVIVGTSA